MTNKRISIIDIRLEPFSDSPFWSEDGNLGGERDDLHRELGLSLELIDRLFEINAENDFGKPVVLSQKEVLSLVQEIRDQMHPYIQVGVIELS